MIIGKIYLKNILEINFTKKKMIIKAIPIKI